MLEFPPRMVLQRFLRILPFSTHFHVNIFVVEIKLNKENSLLSIRFKVRATNKQTNGNRATPSIGFLHRYQLIYSTWALSEHMPVTQPIS